MRQHENVRCGLAAGRFLVLTAGILVTLFASGVAAQNAPRNEPVQLTLSDCIRIGLNNQAAIQVQIAATGIAQQQEAVAQSYFYPQVDVQTRFTNASSISTVAIPNPISGQLADAVADSRAYFGIAKQAGSATAQAALDNPNVPVAPGLPSFNSARQAVLNGLPATFNVDLLGQNFLTTQVTLVQPLWTGGKIRYRRQQAELGTRAAQYDVERTRQETIFNITRAYLTILLTSDMVSVAEATEGQFNVVESLTGGFLRVHKYVTEADLCRIKSLRCSASGERAGLDRVREQAYAGLRLAMGLDQQNAIKVADAGLKFGENRDYELRAVLCQALAQRPDLAKAEIGVKAAMLEQQLARAAYCPEVGAFATFGNVWDDGHFANPTHPNEGTVGVAVQIPLFAGGRRIAESHEADFQQARATQIRRLMAELVSHEVQDSYLEYLDTSEQSEFESNKQAACQGIRAMQELDYEHLQQIIADVKKKDMPQYAADIVVRKYFEDRILTRLMLTQALAKYYQRVYNCNVALAKLRLATACDDYKTFVEVGGTDAHLDDTGSRAATVASDR